MKRKLLTMMIAALMLVSTFAHTMVLAAAEFRVTLHGEEIDFGNENPVLIGSSIYVPRGFIAELVGSGTILHDAYMLPLRSTMESFGHFIEWDGATRTANILLQEVEMTNNPGIAVTTFMNNLVAGDYDAVTQMLSPEVQAALTVPFQVLTTGRYGEILDYTVMDSTEQDGLYIATVSANHTKGAAVHQVIVDSNGAIMGLAPLQFDFQPKMPPADANYTAEAVVVGEGTMWALDGLLTIPQNASTDNPVPAIILIPGSGANNMDSSLFANHPFFDIADYLSNNGIAVLRYNERAFTHGMQLGQVFGANFTMQEEYIEDTLLAAQLLRDDDRISQVFLLGHSLGGIVAPRIAEEAGLDGVVIMASSPRPLHQILYDQRAHIINDAITSGTMSQDDADVALATLATQLEEAQHALTLPVDQLENIFLFDMFPALYERSLMESLPLPFIANNTDRPVLILQGGRDFQTTVEADFQVFLDSTVGMMHVTTRLYEALNHLMMTAKIQSGPLAVDVMEYAIPGNVDEQVLRDIVDWIMAQ